MAKIHVKKAGSGVRAPRMAGSGVRAPRTSSLLATTKEIILGDWL